MAGWSLSAVLNSSSVELENVIASTESALKAASSFVCNRVARVPIGIGELL